MKPKEQAEYMVKFHKGSNEALKAHHEIMENISNIYNSIEDARKRSMSYNHLEEVEKEIKSIQHDPTGKKWKPFSVDCDRCGNGSEVFTDSQEAGWVYDDDLARCTGCELKGVVMTEDGQAWIEWDEFDLKG